MNNKICVAHFVREYIRVTETFIYNQIRTLKNNNNFDPVVFCKKFYNNFRESEIYPFMVTDNLPFINKIFDDIAYNYFRYLTNSAADNIVEQLRKTDTKLLHFHYLVDARFFLKIIFKTHLPSVISAYGWDVSQFPRKYYGFGKKYLIPLFKEADYILAMSEDMKKDLLLLGVPESKVIIHYHGINFERFKFIRRDYNKTNKINILFCGRLEYKKAPDLVLKSLKIIENKKLSSSLFRITFVGEGKLRRSIESLIRDYGWEDKVSLLGHIPHLSNKLLNQYENADIFILPSMVSQNDKEGIPGTLIEAMASGLPIVSTYHAGIPEIIDSNKNGFLVKEGDLEDMAKKISDLMNDTELRKKIGINARKKIEEFNLNIKTKKLEEIYAMIINRKNN